MSVCKRCGSEILFRKRPGAHPRSRGAWVPLEPQSDPRGMYAIVNDRVVLADRSTPEDAPRHHPHAVFCEGAGRPRRSLLSEPSDPDADPIPF